MKCPKCGSDIEEQSFFCYMCGARIQFETSESVSQTNDDSDLESFKSFDSNKYKDTKRIKVLPTLITITAAILIIMSAVYFYYAWSSYKWGCMWVDSGDYEKAKEYFDKYPLFLANSKNERFIEKGYEDINCGKLESGLECLYMSNSAKSHVISSIDKFCEAQNWHDAFQLYNLTCEKYEDSNFYNSSKYSNLIHALYDIQNNDFGLFYEDAVLSDIEKSTFKDLDYYYDLCDNLSSIFYYDNLYNYDLTRINNVEEILYNNNIIPEKRFCILESNLNKLNGIWQYTDCVDKKINGESINGGSNYCGRIEISNGYYACYSLDNNQLLHSGFLDIISPHIKEGHYKIKHENWSEFDTEYIDEGIIYIPGTMNSFYRYEKISN